MQLLRRNWFVLALAAAVLLAWLFPEWGRRGGILRSEITTKAGVIFIFLVQGLMLRTEALFRGLRNWRFHLLCHGCIFALAPLLFALLLWPFLGVLPEELRLGFFFLSVLPTTISSAVVLTQRAQGDVTAALFNGTLSNLAGVLVVPLAVLAYGAGGSSFNAGSFGDALGRVAALILLPFVLGQLLRPLLREQATRHKARLSQASSLLIAFMVFAAFSNSFANRLWQREEPTTVMLTLGLVLVLMAALHGGVFLLGRRALGADRQALLAPLVLCGSQKTLAAGLPMAQSLFAASALNLGLLLLPLLLYHPIQLLLGGVIANTFRRRINASAPPASAPAPGPMASTPATQR